MKVFDHFLTQKVVSANTSLEIIMYNHLWVIQDIYFRWRDAKLPLQRVRVEPGIDGLKRCILSSLSLLKPYQQRDNPDLFNT